MERQFSEFKAKIILTGEFSAVLGADSLLLPLNFKMRGYAKVSEGKGKFSIEGKEVKFDKRRFEGEFKEIVESMLEMEGNAESKIFSYLYSYFIGNKRFPFDAEIIIESDIPQKQGLGSSAAFCLTLVKWFEVRL